MAEPTRELIWRRHVGGSAQSDTVRITLGPHQPVLRDLHLDEIDWREGLCALVREHTCARRDLEASEIAAVRDFLESLVSEYLHTAMPRAAR